MKNADREQTIAAMRETAERYRNMLGLHCDKLELLEGFEQALDLLEAQEWVRIEDEAPGDVVFDAYSPEWVDEDFNPEGIRECYRNQGEEPELEYVSAAFVPMQDCWTESNDRPTHWRKRVGPTPPSEEG